MEPLLKTILPFPCFFPSSHSPSQVASSMQYFPLPWRSPSFTSPQQLLPSGHRQAPRPVMRLSVNSPSQTMPLAQVNLPRPLRSPLQKSPSQRLPFLKVTLPGPLRHFPQISLSCELVEISPSQLSYRIFVSSMGSIMRLFIRPTQVIQIIQSPSAPAHPIKLRFYKFRPEVLPRSYSAIRYNKSKRVKIQMSMENQNTQPVIIPEEGFIVKVKLLSNKVFEIPTSPTTLVADFKKLVHLKTQVPVERQRLVFSGKQLLDGTALGDYVKESGLTVHLIARSNPPENPQPAQQQQTQQPQPQQQVPPRPAQMPMPFQPLFGSFGMMNQPNNPQQQQNNPFAQNINSAVNNLMGSLGIRLPPPPNVPNQQPQQPVQQPTQFSPPPAQQQPPRAPVIQNVPPSPQIFRPLDQLEENINRVVIMGEHTNVHANPRVNAINYLRRLQNNMLRFIPQLNRGIQLLQEGRTTHLPDLIQILESLNASNTGAVQLLRTLSAEQPQHSLPHHVHTPHCNHNHPQQQQQQQQQPQQQQAMEVEPEMTATIVIAEDQNNGQLNFQMSTNNPNPQGQQILNTLSSFLQPGTGSGFNFANLFAPPQPPQPQPPQPQPPQPQQQSQPLPAQQSQVQNQAQQVPAQQQQSQPQQPQAENPLAGVNMMSMFNSLQQSGGMGALLGMSLGAMLQEEGQPTTVYSAILTPITGSEILACFTQKDFTFISRKRDQFREATLKAISVAGSRENLVEKYSTDLGKLLMPEGSVSNEEVCRKRVSKILHRHIENLVGHFLNTSTELALTETVLDELKSMYCEAIEEIGKHSQSIDIVFGNIKRGFVQSFDQMIPGFSGMLYSIIERDLVRIYREYITEKKRRQEMSAEQAQDEAELLKMIETEGKEDAEEMAGFEHSQFYPQ